MIRIGTWYIFYTNKKGEIEMKLLNKKIILSLISICFLMTSVNVYAATLNTNILELIKAGYASIQTYFTQSADNELSNVQKEKESDIQQYINSSSDKSISNIQQHMNNELARADSEVNTHVNEIKKQLDSAMANEEDNVKKQITNEVNQNIDDIKATLDKDLEKIIKDKLKK